MSSPSPTPPSITCCLPGYTYNSGTGFCEQAGQPDADPVPCACCPRGYTFIDGRGMYLDPSLIWQHISNSNPTPFFNTCSQIVNGTYAMPPVFGIDPLACPCCLPGYTWVDSIAGCVDNINTKIILDPIPCIPCLCTIPVIPSPCIECQSSSGDPISFAANPFVKQCKNCSPQNFQLTHNPKLNCFMPYFLILPNTNNFNLES